MMNNLLRADFYRIKKDIILLISLILLVFFALSTPLLYTILELVASDSFAELEVMGMSPSGKSIFTSSFSLSNNFGLILPVLIGIIICRDFSAGTVRNKIIAGCRKPSIYLSMQMSAVAVGTVLFIIYAFFSLGAGSLIHGYGEPFNKAELIYLLKVLIMGIFIFASMFSIAVFFATLTKSIGITIILQISASIFFAVLGSIPIMLPNAPAWLETLCRITPSYQIFLASKSVSLELLLTSLISSTVTILLTSAAGMLLFRKNDIK